MKLLQFFTKVFAVRDDKVTEDKSKRRKHVVKVDEKTQQALLNVLRKQEQREKSSVDEKSTQGPSQVQSGADKVNLSQIMERISTVGDFLDELPNVRAERVAQLKAKIEAGEYSVDSKEVAKKLLAALK
jgi:negative regulator of flagellin synthesis FlgM